MAAAIAGFAVERAEAPRAAATLLRGDETLGLFKVQFKTMVPLPRKDGVVGTLRFDPRGQAGLVHRILMDTQRGLYYGYDILLSKAEVPGRFVVAVKPLDASEDREFRERLWGDFCQGCDAPRPVAHTSQRYPQPQVVAPGDTLSVDLLADGKSGELISEEITVSVPDMGPRPVEVLPARDLKAENVWLQMAEAELSVNGQPVGEPKGPSVQGEVVWVQLPDRGRAFLSLVPRGGYDFRKIGVASANKISFTIEGVRYEWVAEGPIVTAGPVPPFNNVQSWHVWVLHDRDFQPGPNAQGGMGAGLDERAKNRLKRP
jgi:hypothetical protein